MACIDLHIVSFTLLMSFMVCTGETKSGLAWTHTKPTLNPTNTHTNLYKCGGEQEI